MILLLKLVAEKSATTFGDLPDCLREELIWAGESDFDIK